MRDLFPLQTTGRMSFDKFFVKQRVENKGPVELKQDNAPPVLALEAPAVAPANPAPVVKMEDDTEKPKPKVWPAKNLRFTPASKPGTSPAKCWLHMRKYYEDSDHKTVAA